MSDDYHSARKGTGNTLPCALHGLKLGSSDSVLISTAAAFGEVPVRATETTVRGQVSAASRLDISLVGMVADARHPSTQEVGTETEQSTVQDPLWKRV